MVAGERGAARADARHVVAAPREALRGAKGLLSTWRTAARDLKDDLSGSNDGKPVKPSMSAKEVEQARKTAVQQGHLYARNPEAREKARASALSAAPEWAAGLKGGVRHADDVEAWVMMQEVSGILSPEEACRVPPRCGAGLMSQENVELVGQAVEAFNEVGMAEAARRFFAPDGVFEEPPEQPTPSVAEGRDAAVRLFEQFDEMWEEHRSEVEEIRAVDDDRVLLLSIEHFRGRDGLRSPSRVGASTRSGRARSSGCRPFGNARTLSRLRGCPSRS